MSELTAFIIDDDPVVRQILELVLRDSGIPVETFGSAAEFLRRCPPDRPGCVVLDLRLPGGMGGLELQREMLAQGYRQPVIILTAHGDVPTTVKAIKAGAVDFLIKPVKNDELLAAVRSAFAHAGQAPPRPSPAPPTSQSALLTHREREVVRLAIDGKSSKEIGRQLGISHRTVEVHRAHALEKTGARNILEVARRWWGAEDET